MRECFLKLFLLRATEGRSSALFLSISHHEHYPKNYPFGLLVDLPSIGCAKKRLVGHYQEPAREQGSFAYLDDAGEVIGAAVRTRPGVKPVFVSIRHRVDLSTAVDYVLACGCGYRLPEPIRWADKIAGGAQPPSTPNPITQQPMLFDKV